MTDMLFYIQVHTEANSYWYRQSNVTGQWISHDECKRNELPTALNIFEAKRIIAKDKEDDPECVYFLIPATNKIQIIN